MSSLPEVFDAFRSSIMRDLRVALPARVETYDADKQKASVQPLLRSPFATETGEAKHERLPMVNEVPVQWQSGGGAFLTFPLAKGDTGLLVFTDLSLDEWLQHGGEVEPMDPRAHHLSDGVFIPGLYPFGMPRQGTSSSHVVLHVPAGTELHLGEANPTDFVAMAQKVLDRLNAIVASFNGHSHTAVLTVDPILNTATGSTNSPTDTMAAPASVASTTVKVKG